jgi:hypothetical protein
LARPLVSEAVSVSEPDRDLNTEFFSARLDVEDREPDRTFPRPLSCEPTMEREPDRDLKIEDF